MIVRAFYNSKAFKNVLYVVLKEKDVVDTIKKNNVCKLIGKDDEIIGYNIFLDEFNSKKDGYQKMTPELLKIINTNLYNAFNEELIHDFNDYIVVGEVLECEEHPDSDHMHVCKVNVGNEVLQIVCGAHNVKKGIKVVTCKENAVMPNGSLITKGKLRGIESYGMLASEYELGLIEEKKKGILILDDTYSVGDAFFK